jgi:hypothetical protein
MPGLTLDIAANSGDFIRATKDVDKALDGVADSLDDAARDGEQATERVEDSFRELARAAERETKRAADDMSRNIDRGAAHASESMSEVKSEALANASETFSSFEGDAQSFADGIQGALGGLIVGLSGNLPAAAAVAAGALGVGLISAALGQSEEQAEALRQKVSELTAEFIEAGPGGRRSADQFVEALRELATESDRGRANLVDMKIAAEDLGVPLDDIARAYLEGGEPLDQLIEKTEALLKAEERRTARPGGRRAENDLQEASINNLEDELRLYREQAQAIEAAQDAQLLYLETGVSEFEAKVSLIETVDQAYDDAAGSTDDFVNAETGLFDTDAYITAMQQREQALRDYQTTLTSSDLSTEAKAFLNEQGAEAAALMLAGYASAEPAQRAELNRIWSEAGKSNSGTYVDTLTKEVTGAQIGAPTVAFDPVTDAQNYLAAVQRELRRNPLSVTVLPRDQFGEALP